MNKISKKKARTWYWSLQVISWICLVTPLMIWVFCNFNRYFVQKSGWSVAMGGVLSILMVVLLLKYGVKKFNGIFWLTALLIVVYCCNSIIQDMLYIVFFGWIGGVIYFVLEFPTKYFKNKLDLINNTETVEYNKQRIRQEYYDPNINLTKTKEEVSGRC